MAKTPVPSWERSPAVSIEQKGDQELSVKFVATKMWGEDRRAVAVVCKRHLKSDDALVLFQSEPREEGDGGPICWYCHDAETRDEADRILMRIWALLDPSGFHDAPLDARVAVSFKLVEEYSNQNAVDGECVPPRVYKSDQRRALRGASNGKATRLKRMLAKMRDMLDDFDV